MTWPQRPGGRDLPMGKKKRKLQGLDGQGTSATPLVQDGVQAAAAGNHEDEGIPLLRPGLSPSQGVMGTMESSNDADDLAAASVNGAKDVPLAWVNSGDPLLDTSLQLAFSDIQGHVDSSLNSSNGDSVVSQSDPRYWRLPGLDLDIIAKATSYLSSLSSSLASKPNSADSSFRWSGLSFASPVATQKDASESSSPRSVEVASDLGAIGELPADDATSGVGAAVHADTELGSIEVDKEIYTGTRSANSGEGAPDLQPGQDLPASSATANSVQDEYCMKCNSTHWTKTGENRLLLCDTPNCPRGCHLRCLGLLRAPRGAWFCDHCSLKREPSLNIPPEFQGPPVIPGSFLDIWAKNGARSCSHCCAWRSSRRKAPRPRAEQTASAQHARSHFLLSPPISTERGCRSVPDCENGQVMTASTADKPSQLLSFKHCPKLLWYAHAGQAPKQGWLRHCMLSAHSDMKH